MKTPLLRLILATGLAVAAAGLTGCQSLLREGSTEIVITAHEDGRAEYRYRSPKDIDLTIPTEHGDIRAKSATNTTLAESAAAANAAATEATAQALKSVADKFPSRTP